MATDGDRSPYLPAIENQIARLREGFGFSQAHANAVVMYVRGILASVQKKTVRVPLDWKVDDALLRDLVAARMAQLTAPT